MPRYMLEDADMAILITYLKALSARYSPGVSASTIRFATVITDDVTQEDRDSMLAPLQKYINIKNNQAKTYNTPLGKKSRQMVPDSVR